MTSSSDPYIFVSTIVKEWIFLFHSSRMERADSSEQHRILNQLPRPVRIPNLNPMLTSATDEGGNESSSSTATNEDASDSKSGDSRSSESGESSAPSFQISTVDANVVASNLRDSIDSNTAEVLSALGLDDISPTPASELTPARISQSLNDARQVYQSLSFSSLDQDPSSIASDLSSNMLIISSTYPMKSLTLLF